MEKYEITIKDKKQNYFHFTKRKNLKNISAKGLIPRIGWNARHIEKTPKIFFVEGLDNLLILFDCWINCLCKLPLIPFIYLIGARCIRWKWFPKIIADGYFNMVSKSKFRKRKAFKQMDKLLDSYVLLNLNIEDGIDFKYEDDDEIKKRGYEKEHLITMGYSLKYSNVDTTTMDRWNMHTLSNHGIKKEKIKLCYLENSDKLENIFIYALEKTNIDLKAICPSLSNYLEYKKMKGKNN